MAENGPREDIAKIVSEKLLSILNGSNMAHTTKIFHVGNNKTSRKR